MIQTLEAPSVPAPTRSRLTFLDAARAACSRIAPLWPLQDFVAANPFLGLADRPFTAACDLMQRLLPGGMQMPATYYREKLGRGALSDADLTAAIARSGEGWTPAFVREQLNADDSDDLLLTVAEAVDRQYGTSWSSAVTEAIGHFCAAYFDAGQSAWRLPWRDRLLFEAWREYASLDAQSELLGLKKFRSFVQSLPPDANDALTQLLPLFRLDERADDFLHKQLLTVRGWAGHVQFRVRENCMRGVDDDTLLQLLAIRLAYDAALLAQYDSPAFREFWSAHGEVNSARTTALFICQLADEHPWQQQLLPKLRAPAQIAKERPAAQAVFCIDVRSEVFRRALESIEPRVQTLGFAGFFGLPLEVVPFGMQHAVAQCPVLLTPKYRVREKLRRASAREEEHALDRQHMRKRITHAWNSFKTSAISCFSFVETAGLMFGGKLFRSAFAPAKPAPAHGCGCGPNIEPDEARMSGIPLDDRVALAAGALRNMGLTQNFARIVLLCGHGSLTTNNPYAAGLDCGACGGHAGDTNSRVAAAILNDPNVRAALAESGLAIPADTWFIAGLHNTSTDEVTLFDLDLAPPSHACDIADLQISLTRAGAQARRERASSLHLEDADPKIDEHIAQRSRDWSQVRPEWGLAGNAAFIAAPRARTRGVDLGGRAFLHDYDHRADTDNSTLELIMCAPMIVANWINLQYFASTVNNAAFGSGNKVIHNVVGTLGVCLGNGGDLQTGLPLQSVHDGQRWIHEPLRLHALIEAPRDRIDAVLAKHADVRQLVEHGWLLLFAIEDDGATLRRFIRQNQWERVS